MKPEVFLEQKDVLPLVKALIKVLMSINSNDYQSVLENAGIHSALIGRLRLSSSPNILVQTLVAEFKKYSIDNKQLDYHPMINLLDYFCGIAEIYSLSEQDVTLFQQLVEKGQENFKALKACNAVGRIESPKGHGIGTGVLVGSNLLLTCNHVFSKTQVQQAWVRFGYKSGSYGLEDVFELDLKFISYNNRLDYALVRIQGEPQQAIISPTNTLLNDYQEIRLIHHPLGKAVEISDVGKIIRVGEEYIDHNIIAKEGSSGAPIFNSDWELVAIHQGHPGIGREIIQGTLGGIPIRAISSKITPYLA